MSEQSMFYKVTYATTFVSSIDFDDDLFSLEEWNEMSKAERLDYLTDRFDTDLEGCDQPTNYNPSLTVIVGLNKQEFALDAVAEMNSTELVLRGIVK